MTIRKTSVEGKRLRRVQALAITGWLFFVLCGVILGFVLARFYKGEWQIWPVLVMQGAYALGMLAGSSVAEARKECGK